MLIVTVSFERNRVYQINTWNGNRKRDPPKSQFKGQVGVMRWNDASKTKSVKFVSMLSTIHTFEMVDSDKIGRSTGAVIQKPDVIMDYNVDLGSRVLIPYSSQRHRVK